MKTWGKVGGGGGAHAIGAPSLPPGFYAYVLWLVLFLVGGRGKVIHAGTFHFEIHDYIAGFM